MMCKTLNGCPSRSAEQFQKYPRSCASNQLFNPRDRHVNLWRELERRAFPSFSTSTIAPESATRKFAPPDAMPASKKLLA